LGIKALYYNEDWKMIEKDLFDFEARVYCHGYDQVQGMPFIHWKVSQGEIEIKEEYKNEKLENLEIVKNK
jgi:peptide deformylase